jgi:hypothetical protein
VSRDLNPGRDVKPGSGKDVGHPILPMGRTVLGFVPAVAIAALLVACTDWIAPDPRCQGVPGDECQAAADAALELIPERDRAEAEVLAVRRSTATACNGSDTPRYDVDVRFPGGDLAMAVTVGSTSTGHLVLCTY